MSGPQRIVFGAWLGMVGLATARSLGGSRGLPQPSVYLSSAVLFTLLYGAAGIVGPLAAVFAVGVDIAALVLPYVRGGTTGPLDSIAQGLASISGGPSAAAAPAAGAAGPRTVPGPGGSTPGTLVRP